jgi:uncharacterized protein YecE (DUF72 family)
MERIATAGWSLPQGVRHRFAAEGSILARYASRFSAVEINSSFYRPHRRQTYERWAASTHAGFRFSVKAPRALTHELRLATPEAVLPAFLKQATGLGEKLDVILVQLPPKLAFDEVGDAFLARWRDFWRGATAIEPRHPSWFTAEVDARLVDAHIARVGADPAVVPAAAEPGGWRGLTYLRLHGSPVMYDSAYDDAALANVAQTLAAQPTGTEAWCVFDNTRRGAAAADALRLLDRLG